MRLVPLCINNTRESPLRVNVSDLELQQNIRVYKEGEVCKKEIQRNLNRGDQGSIFFEINVRSMPFHEGIATYWI